MSRGPGRVQLNVIGAAEESFPEWVSVDAVLVNTYPGVREGFHSRAERESVRRAMRVLAAAGELELRRDGGVLEARGPRLLIEALERVRADWESGIDTFAEVFGDARCSYNSRRGTAPAEAEAGTSSRVATTLPDPSKPMIRGVV